MNIEVERGAVIFVRRGCVIWVTWDDGDEKYLLFFGGGIYS